MKQSFVVVQMNLSKSWNKGSKRTPIVKELEVTPPPTRNHESDLAHSLHSRSGSLFGGEVQVKSSSAGLSIGPS